MKKTIISVIVPIYNTIKYLKECLDSIVSQTYEDFQIILVDDGSTDGCEQICDEYANKDKRITVIHQQNSGIVMARKAGLQKADGVYIYYVDSDDWIDNNIIMSFMEIILKHAVDMISVGVKREYGNGKTQTDVDPFEKGLYLKEDICNKVIPHLINTNKFFEWGQHLTYWHYLIKKELLIKNLENVSNRIRMADDVACIYPCILDAAQIYINGNEFYHYRQRNDSVKWTEDSNEYENLQELYRLLSKRFNKEVQAKELMKKAKYLILFEILTSTSNRLLFEHNSTFPYQYFPQDSKVVVYGAGLFGNKVINALKKYNYGKVVGWVDKNYELYQKKGYSIESPELLKRADYDYIIIAAIRADIRENIIESLLNYNVPMKKIIDIDMEQIDNKSLPKEFENNRTVRTF